MPTATKRDLNQVAMEVILAAGDARNCADEAMDSMAEFDFDAAEQHLADADAKIVKAHNVQTEVIQAQVSGEEEFDYSILFVHAQDTLMTINSELRLAKKMLAMMRAIDGRLAK